MMKLPHTIQRLGLTRAARTMLGVALLGSLALLWAHAPAAAQTLPAATQPAQPAKPTTAVPFTSCVTAQCHANVKNYKVVHGPVNVNACDACHKLADASTHHFVPAREKSQSCTFCHQIDTSNMAVVHKPVMTGDCTGCHDPHGGQTNRFLRAGSMGQVCNQCHQDVVGDKTHVHGPVAAGACDACHLPHASPNAKLLVAEGKDLCFYCHKEMAQQVKTAKAQHKPVSDSECTKCHDPHASNFTKQTRKAPLELCTSCHQHEPILKDATESAHKHSVVTDKNACLNCHTAHGGQLSKLLRKEPIKLCTDCHAKPIKAADGHTVASVSEVLDPTTSKHGPIREGSCSGCHKPHGSETAKLLAKPYPESFYQSFSMDKYGLCFSCHDQQLVEAKEAKGLTNFRNGEENLHYLHVNREKGRNCRSCHATHASENDLHVRDAVPFGKWSMPIQFKKNENGGTCSPGCHKTLTYDRVTPQVYDAGQANRQDTPASVAESKAK